MADLIPSLDSDVELDVADSSEDEFVGVKGSRRRGGISFDGLVDKRATRAADDGDDDGDEKSSKAAVKPAKTAWSFRDAIQQIDATSSGHTQSFGTSLREKVAAVRAASTKGRAAPVAPKRAAKAAEVDSEDDEGDDAASEGGEEEDDDEEGDDFAEGDDSDDDEEDGDDEDDDDEGEESDGDDDDDAEEEEEEAGAPPASKRRRAEPASDDEDDEEDEEEEEDGSDDEDDEEEDAGAAASSSSSSSSRASAATGTGASLLKAVARGRKADAVESILASARPNPHRSVGSAAAGGAGSTVGPTTSAAAAARYGDLFTVDPFEAAAADTVRAMKGRAVAAGTAALAAGGAGAAASASSSTGGVKRSRATMEAASAAAGAGATSGDLPHHVPVTVEGLADGSALKEPRTFAEANLSRPLLKATTALGYKAPTPIQRRCIPLALAGHDICGSAVTGSGKTAAYLLPILERLLYKSSRTAATRVIILTPTRELATQVHSMANQLAQFCPSVRAALVVGGLALKPQEAELRTRPDIIVATPGRLLDHLRNSMGVTCEDVDVLVLDEADRLLEMGFEDEVRELVKMCPVGRQTLLFSATMTPRVDALVALSLRKPIRVLADPLYDMAGKLSQEFIRIRPGKEDDREAMLMALVTRSFTGGGVLIFAIHKKTAHRLAILLAMAGLSAAELHGNLSQRQRLQALEDFREGKVDYLVATDLAGRGLDIAGVRAVINFEMPVDLAAYVHRVGRTARAGRAGVAVTLVNDGQRAQMKEIIRRAALNVKARLIPSEVVAEWRETIESWEEDIDAVQVEERAERAARIAEMEVDKATNLLEHRDEIMSRPARTWFQSESSKIETAKRAAAAAWGDSTSPAAVAARAALAAADAEAVAAAKGTGKKGGKKAAAEEEAKRPHRMSRKKRRRMEAKAEDERDERRIKRAEAIAAREAAAEARSGRSDDRAAGSGGGKREPVAAAAIKARLAPDILRAKKDMEAAAKVAAPSRAKAAKAAVRDRALQLGVTPGIASRMLHREGLLGKKAKKGTGKKRGGDASGEDGEEGGSSRRGGGGGGGGGFGAEMKDARQGVSGAGGGRGKAAGGGGGRGGLPLHKPGRKSFKSKAKFKRR